MRAVLIYASISFVLAGCSVFQKSDQNMEAETLVVEPDVDQSSEILLDLQSQLKALNSAQAKTLSSISSLQSDLKRVETDIDGLSKQLVITENQDVGANTQVMSTAQIEVLNGKAVLGRVEYIWLDYAQTYLKSRIDTGAKTSSIHATDIQHFERNGDPWVSFVVEYETQMKSIEAPLHRHVRIRQATSEGLERRPVVKLKISLGELHEETAFTLTDRGEMLYPVLLGRNFLRDIAVVDVAKKFTRKRSQVVQDIKAISPEVESVKLNTVDPVSADNGQALDEESPITGGALTKEKVSQDVNLSEN